MPLSFVTDIRGIKTRSLMPEVRAVMQDKKTEPPFTGMDETWDEPGTFLCRQCGLALFRSTSKFQASCGWPSFDQALLNNVQRLPDPDGVRTEIICGRCQGHLGHVFEGEQFTPRNTRYCVNSLSLDFVENLSVKDTEEILLAAGCFWGVEYLLRQLSGVLKTEVGYCGGSEQTPSYEKVCEGHTGYVETVRVIYDPEKISIESLLKYFFEIHDFSQIDGQGPDRGKQYASVIFYYFFGQETTAKTLIQQLKAQGFFVATRLCPVSVFFKAEDYHQAYYQKNHQKPYCHYYRKIFNP